MDLIPHDELKPSSGFNFAPMIDFLFLMLSLFATLAISRTALFDSDIELAKVNKGASDKTLTPSQEVLQVNLSVSKEGAYKWITEFAEHSMDSLEQIQLELTKQYNDGAISKDKSKTEILLHIDEKAPWGAIADLIFAVKEMGFTPHPVYQEKKTLADKTLNEL